MTVSAQRFLTGLSVLNLVLLLGLWLSPMEAALATQGRSVLRGRGLEIVDEHGRVRASIRVQPAETFQPTGRKYPETVVLRLIDPDGRPEVKIVASTDGGGLSLVGNSDATQVHLEADGGNSSLRLTNTDGRERRIEP